MPVFSILKWVAIPCLRRQCYYAAEDIICQVGFLYRSTYGTLILNSLTSCWENNESEFVKELILSIRLINSATSLIKNDVWHFKILATCMKSFYHCTHNNPNNLVQLCLSKPRVTVKQTLNFNNLIITSLDPSANSLTRLQITISLQGYFSWKPNTMKQTENPLTGLLDSSKVRPLQILLKDSYKTSEIDVILLVQNASKFSFSASFRWIRGRKMHATRSFLLCSVSRFP